MITAPVRPLTACAMRAGSALSTANARPLRRCAATSCASTTLVPLELSSSKRSMSSSGTSPTISTLATAPSAPMQMSGTISNGPNAKVATGASATSASRASSRRASTLGSAIRKRSGSRPVISP
jgi:hypothetical protein